MAKAINWPVQYRETVLSEASHTLLAAVRLGRLYYDNQFWVPEEEVDIRVNSLRVRRGIVKDELQCCRIRELGPEVYKLLKADIQSEAALINFLQQTYATAVTPDTEVTVVHYVNLPIDPELLETPRR